MAKSMVHWNINQLCAIDLETTGLIPWYHEPMQIAMVPLDSNFDFRNDVSPLNLYIQPAFPERIDGKALKASKISLKTLARYGVDKDKALEYIEEWINRLDLKYNKFGTQAKVMLLGHNITFDRMFLQHWMGMELFEALFSYHVVDTMAVCQFVNDRAGYRAQQIPIAKINLTYACSEMGVPFQGAHDALNDAVACAKLYKTLVKKDLNIQ